MKFWNLLISVKAKQQNFYKNTNVLGRIFSKNYLKGTTMHANHHTYAPRRKYRYNKLTVPLDMNGVGTELYDIGKIVYRISHNIVIY